MARPAGDPASVLPAILAILGGAGICFLTVYAVVYEPLHYHFSVNFGEPLQFGDLLAFASGAGAIAIGVLLLTRPGNLNARAILLALAGLPTLLFALLWTFPSTFHLDTYPHPFYFGFVYFAELGQAQFGSSYAPRYVQVPLIVSCLLVAGAGLVAALAAPRRSAAAVR